jgi:hypothetical protein
LKTIFACKLFLIILFLFPGSSSCSIVAANVESIERMSVNVDPVGEPLVKVLEEISKKTGYEFLLSGEWESIVVRGHFVDVSIEKFFQRVFRGENTLIDVDKNKHIVSVQLFEKYKVSPYSRIGRAGTDIVRKNDELISMYNEQKAELELLKNDDDAIDPETGVPQGQLKLLHTEQMAEYQKNKDDNNAIDPETGVLQGELKLLHEEQVSDLYNFKNDDDTIDPETGVTQGELTSLHAKQMSDYQKFKNDDNAIDPETGVPHGELKLLHAKQMAELTH